MPKILKILISIFVLCFILLIVFMASTIWLIYYRSTPEYGMKDDFEEVQQGNVTLSDKYDIMWNDFDNSKDIFEEYGYEVDYVENSSGKSPSNLKFNNYKFSDGTIGDLEIDNEMCKDEQTCIQIYIDIEQYDTRDSVEIYANNYDDDDKYNIAPEKSEEVFQKWKKDLNNMFNEYVEEVYGCTYQKDC